ncbi:MAG: hypothetical protein Q8L55_15485 [Phycisphaerales bacterium]|nr:hypothetical protein [Phycisphaerales bacterium]
MSTSPHGTITFTRCGGVESHWRRVIQRCEEGAAGQVQTLKTDGTVSVFALPGENGAAGLVIKRWELRTLGARLKSAFKWSRAWRHWEGASRLTKAGVRTAACYAIARSKSDDGAALEWLIMDRLPGKTLLQHLADNDLPVQTQHRLAEAAACMIVELIKARLYNRDGKPSNLIVNLTNPQRPDIGIIDCVAIRPMPKGGGKSVDMLAALVIEPLGCRCQPRRALMMRALRSYAVASGNAPRASWRPARDSLWRAVEAFVKAHGDPTPKVNPLA